MATYKEQLEVAQSYRLKDGDRYRGNCPHCGGRNTYEVKLLAGELRWGCFKASCPVGGINSGDMSIKGILARVKEEQPSTRPLAPIPTPLVAASNHPAAMKFLATYNSLEAYQSGLIDVRYAPTEDRVLFPVGSLGWIGRGRKDTLPKWKKYGDCSSLCTCGSGTTAVVVEDSLSACAVGVIPEYTGCSLSGTILTQTHIQQLRAFDRIIIALDPDANQKALGMVARLSGTSSVTMRMLDNDLKYFSGDKIRRMLEYQVDE